MLFKKELTEYNRYQAFAIHMAISLVIFLILLVCITQYWYPGILFDTGNGWKAIGLIIGIDLILGPLLTLIVFNPQKSSIKFDLAVIALIQTAALIYGSWTIHQTRPIALAFINTSFLTIHANSDLAGELSAQVKKLNTNKLYYKFSDNEEKTLIAANFFPYEEFEAEVLQIKSPYISQHDDSSYIINIDPLSSNNRFIIIDNSNGSILGFYSSH